MRSLLRHAMLLSATLLTSTVSCALAQDLSARSTGSVNTSATAILIEPDNHWLGIDGNWSTFGLRVGTPAQDVSVLVSFNLYQNWVVLPQGCSSAASSSLCALSRGGTFDPSQSSTWNGIGIYTLQLEENLGYYGNAKFGYDVVGVGSDSQNLPEVKNSTVAGFAVDSYYLGLFGVNPRPTNFSASGDGSPSYMELLRDQGAIPSLSFGYTAGASYRGLPGSLTLGGYDNSRFHNNNMTFASAVAYGVTTIAIQQIMTPSRYAYSPTGTSLLPNPIYASLDSSVAEIWLPYESCRLFEIEFGLSYDNSSGLYLVNDTLHETLQSRNASISFVLGQTSSGDSITITLPYAAFDLKASSPYAGLANWSRYFPLRRAQNSTQYTLGRTFFQEAYISVDYETGTFNVSQASYNNNNAASNLTTIQSSTAGSSGSTTGSSTSGSSKLSGGAIAGIVVGAVAGLALLILLLVLLCCVRKRRRQHEYNEKGSPTSTRYSAATSEGPHAELEGSTPAVLGMQAMHEGHPPGSSSSGFTPPTANRSTNTQGADAFGITGNPPHAGNGSSHDLPAGALAAAGAGAVAAGAARGHFPNDRSPASSNYRSSNYSASGPRTENDSQERMFIHEMPGDLPSTGAQHGTRGDATDRSINDVSRPPTAPRADDRTTAGGAQYPHVPPLRPQAASPSLASSNEALVPPPVLSDTRATTRSPVSPLHSTSGSGSSNSVTGFFGPHAATAMPVGARANPTQRSLGNTNSNTHTTTSTSVMPGRILSGTGENIGGPANPSNSSRIIRGPYSTTTTTTTTTSTSRSQAGHNIASGFRFPFSGLRQARRPQQQQPEESVRNTTSTTTSDARNSASTAGGATRSSGQSGQFGAAYAVPLGQTSSRVPYLSGTSSSNAGAPSTRRPSGVGTGRPSSEIVRPGTLHKEFSFEKDQGGHSEDEDDA